MEKTKTTLNKLLLTTTSAFILATGCSDNSNNSSYTSPDSGNNTIQDTSYQQPDTLEDLTIIDARSEEMITTDIPSTDTAEETYDAEQPRNPCTPIIETFVNLKDEQSGILARNTLFSLQTDFPDLILKYRHFVDPQHPRAQLAAEAAECVREQATSIDQSHRLVADYVKILFNNQQHLDISSLQRYARDLGLDIRALDSCLESGRKTTWVQLDKQEGLERGVTAPPHSFIGETAIAGNQVIDIFYDAIVQSQDICHLVRYQPGTGPCTDLSQFPGCMVSPYGVFEGFFVVGENSMATDNLSMMDIVTGMMYLNERGELESVQVMDAARLDSEIEDIYHQNIVSIGSACVNTVSAELLGNPDDCTAGLQPDEGSIQLFNHGGYSTLLVFGYSAQNTRIAARTLVNQIDQMYGTNISVFGNDLDNVRILHNE